MVQKLLKTKYLMGDHEITFVQYIHMLCTAFLSRAIYVEVTVDNT